MAMIVIPGLEVLSVNTTVVSAMIVVGHGQYQQRREHRKLHKREERVWGFGEARGDASALNPTLAILQLFDHRHVERMHHLPQEKGMLSPKLQCGVHRISTMSFPSTKFASSLTVPR
jgi:hypothetical protein